MSKPWRPGDGERRAVVKPRLLTVDDAAATVLAGVAVGIFALGVVLGRASCQKPPLPKPSLLEVPPLCAAPRLPTIGGTALE